MKRAVWGTGYYASNFMATQKIDSIDFFIDNDRKKSGQMFLGKKIIHPNEILDWKELYIYIPFNYYEEISMKLESMGLKENIHFSKYERIGCLTEKEAEQDYQRAISEIIEQKNNLYGKYFFWGKGWNGIKGFKQLLLQLQKYDKSIEFALVSEDIWLERKDVEINARINTIITPKIFSQDIYIREIECDIGKKEEIQDVCCQERISQLEGAFPEDVNAELMTYYMYNYINAFMDHVHPKGIVAHSSVTTAHELLGYICKKRNIPIIYTHEGIIPGTLAFDIDGEMGASLPALYQEKFKELPVCKEEIKYAERVWKYLEISKLNRKIQPGNPCTKYILNRRMENQPIVFFAGQNDAASHMVPFTENTRKYHSPIFESSIKAAIYMAKLCEKNKWNFVYKPHPSYIQEDVEAILPSNTIYIETGDINDIIDISDVVVTILSQTNYVALIRHKPVVMLGYNQTRGKGCTYEAFEENQIEETVKMALKNGFTEEQQNAFLIHMTQVLKYYLYDDMRERALRFGRKAPSTIEEFYELEKLLKESEKNG